jgi:RNA polymerase sigma factor (sigma-70 family)
MNAGEQGRVGGATVAIKTAHAGQPGGDVDEAVATFLGMRPRLLAIASRFLAGASEAEDVVQETWLRWQQTDRTVVTDPPALLATITARLAINVSQSARRRRETSVLATAPEAATPDDGPETRAESHEVVQEAVLVVLESLAPRERAAFVLREAFDYPYGQISEFLDLGPASARQVVSRARRRIDANRHTIVSPAAHQLFLRTFLDAARAGELTAFEALLAADLAA